MKVYHYFARVDNNNEIRVLPVRDRDQLEENEGPITITLSGETGSVAVHSLTPINRSEFEMLFAMTELIPETFTEEQDEDEPYV